MAELDSEVSFKWPSRRSAIATARLDTVAPEGEGPLKGSVAGDGGFRVKST
jgi:hypothetical protein